MNTTISRPARFQPIPIDSAPGGPNHTDSRPASSGSVPKLYTPDGAKPADRLAVDDARPLIAIGSDGEPGQVPTLLDPALCLAADILDDLQRVRTANENRLRQLTRSEEDSDGQLRGFGLDESHPDVARLAAMVATLKKVEHRAVLQLQRQMRRHPLHGWVKAQRGVGEKQAARLLAAIGDPYVNSATGLPRTVSALWAYCGLHVLPVDNQRSSDAHRNLVADRDGGDLGRWALDTQDPNAGVAPKRVRGQQANWSVTAKTRAYLIAESCLKQIRKPCHAAAFEGRWLPVHYNACACSPYRVVYDRRRAHTATTHRDWTDGHSHNDALRVASKAVLRDLWCAARDWRRPT